MYIFEVPKRERERERERERARYVYVKTVRAFSGACLSSEPSKKRANQGRPAKWDLLYYTGLVAIACMVLRYMLL